MNVKRKKMDGTFRDQHAAIMRKRAAREAKELTVKGRQTLLDIWEAELENKFSMDTHRYVLHLRDRLRQAKGQLRAMGVDEKLD